MSQDRNPNQVQPPIVWWIIWAAMLSGMLVIYATIGRGAEGRAPSSGATEAWWIGFVPFAISSFIRWGVLPAVKPALAFPLFVAGMALAESAGILGMFAFPGHKIELLVLSVLGMAQFVPYFASAGGRREDQ